MEKKYKSSIFTHGDSKNSQKKTQVCSSASNELIETNQNSTILLNNDLITVSIDPLHDLSKQKQVIKSNNRLFNIESIDYETIPAGGQSFKQSQNHEFRNTNDSESDIKIKTEIPMRNISSKVLETWIKETLNDADVTCPLTKSTHRDPLLRYQIDRMSLSIEGMSTESIDRLYKGLFVHSVGFFEFVNTLTKNVKSKYATITNIWKAFTVLLEYACKVDYRLIVTQIAEENKIEIQSKSKEYEEQIQEMKEKEATLFKNIETLEKYTKKIDEERCDEKGKRMKIEEELLAQSVTHEAEVKLRLKFESKLNTMHAVHRELNEKYKKALIELESLQEDNNLLKNSNSNLLNELDSLKLIRVDLDAKLTNDVEKLSSLSKDIKFKNKYIEDFTERFQEFVKEK